MNGYVGGFKEESSHSTNSSQKIDHSNKTNKYSSMLILYVTWRFSTHDQQKCDFSHIYGQQWFKFPVFDISTVERRQWTNIWDHSELFWFTAFSIIGPNRPFFGENCCICYILGMIYILCNAPIRKLKEILISSHWHLTWICLMLWKTTLKSLSTLLCSLHAARF